jgi:hypothetical protein
MIEEASIEDLEALHDDENPKPKGWFNKSPLSDEELEEIRAAKVNEPVEPSETVVPGFLSDRDAVVEALVRDYSGTVISCSRGQVIVKMPSGLEHNINSQSTLRNVMRRERALEHPSQWRTRRELNL